MSHKQSLLRMCRPSVFRLACLNFWLVPEVIKFTFVFVDILTEKFTRASVLAQFCFWAAIHGQIWVRPSWVGWFTSLTCHHHKPTHTLRSLLSRCCPAHLGLGVPRQYRSITWPVSPLITLMGYSVFSLSKSIIPQYTEFLSFLKIILFIYFWLCWVFAAAWASSQCIEWGYSPLQCMGFSLQRLPLLRSTGSRALASVVVARGLSCSEACGIFPDQGLNLCLLPWQADSIPLTHWGSPGILK